MTRGGILEYKEVVWGRYAKPGKKEKRKILDEFTLRRSPVRTEYRSEGLSVLRSLRRSPESFGQVTGFHPDLLGRPEGVPGATGGKGAALMGEMVHLQGDLKRLGPHTMAAIIDYEVGKAIKSQASYPAFLQRLDFLVVDGLGYMPMDSRRANLFFQLVSARYERGSIGVTTNKPFDQWGQVFGGDDVIAAAILDRLLHHSHILATTGPSYRMKDKGSHLQPVTCWDDANGCPR